MQIQNVNSLHWTARPAPASLLAEAEDSAGFTLRGPDGTVLGTVPGNGTVLEVGRSSSAGLVLADEGVSRKHASLKVNGGELWVRDEGSSNGTFVGGRAVNDRWWHAVGEGESLRFGRVEVLTGTQDAVLVGFSPPAGPRHLQASALPVAAAAVGGPAGAALALQDLKAMARREELDSRQGLLASLQGATEVLESGTGIAELPQGVPTLVIPDIHARREFLVKVMEHELNGEKVFDLLQAGQVNVLCLGDGMHGERRVRERWVEAESDFQAGNVAGSSAMRQEMVESLGTMQMVMDLKTAFPENFHYLRGNHDEMNNPSREYMKFARTLSESGMVRSWVKESLGEDFLERYARFEESMPLAATGQGLVATHAAPGSALTREEIERRDERAFTTLAWTDNTLWEPDGHEREVFQGNLGQLGSPEAHWLVGHRPVQDGLYRGQFDDRLVQVNAPGEFVVALVGADGSFDPKRDIFSL